VVLLLDGHVLLCEGRNQFALLLQVFVLALEAEELLFHPFVVGVDVPEGLLDGFLVVVAETALELLEAAPEVDGGLVLALLRRVGLIH
jgi:hypothetical protein